MARNFDELRKVTIDYGATDLEAAAAMSLDAYRAVIQKVQELEDAYAHNTANVADMTAVNIALVGNHPYKIYVFAVTSVMATGTYTFEYVEEAPNVEGSATFG